MDGIGNPLAVEFMPKPRFWAFFDWINRSVYAGVLFSNRKTM